MKTNATRNGFSMIEVLVASAILTVIVMMLAMLFQQTSVAWRTGLMRANGFMQLRSYIGAIQRDASAAIDAKNIPDKLLYNGKKQSFTASEISFYTLTGTDTNRSLKYVTHLNTGEREQYKLVYSGTTWSWEKDGDRTSLLKFLENGSEDDATIDPQKFKFKFSDGTERDNRGAVVADRNRLPLYIMIEARITQEGKLYEVGASSDGPDKKPDTDDDIRTWVEH